MRGWRDGERERVRFDKWKRAGLFCACRDPDFFGGEVQEYKSQESEPESAPVLQGAQESDKPLPPSPFVAMQGMFAYEKWTESEIAVKGTPMTMRVLFFSRCPTLKVRESWETIRATVQTGLGATGQRKLFIFLRHAQAMHNQWVCTRTKPNS